MNRVEQYLADKLSERKLAGNLRTLTTASAPIDFYSNDYLGLATTGTLASLMRAHPEESLGTGSTGSRLLSGNSALAEDVEQTIASFHKADAALLFNSGFDANMGLLSSLPGKTATVIYDELCHASIIDGIRLSLAACKFKFRHNDVESLDRKIQANKYKGPVFVVVESVYSMDGDMAPLAAIVDLCEKNKVVLIVDEAHATGVIGERGQGLVSALGLEDRVFARVHTYGKALGCHGASVAGSDLLKQYLINFARPFIYTTALPGHSLHAIRCAYQYLLAPGFTNQPLHDLIAYFKACISASGIAGWVDSSTAIQVLIIGDNEQTKAVAVRLQQAGIQVKPVLHPTVPLGRECLRICLHTFNTPGQIDLLFAALQ